MIEKKILSIFFSLSKTSTIVTSEEASKLGALLESVKSSKDFSLELHAKMNKFYTVYCQTEALKTLNLGIDLHRFDADATYRDQTIMGLTDETATFELTCSLARFYGLDLWRVYLNYVDAQMQNERNETCAQLTTQFAPLLPLLTSRMDAFKEHMFENVWPLVAGTELDKLALYYSLFAGDAHSEAHAKALQKIQELELGTQPPSLDYTELLERPLQCIEPHLSEANVHLFAKLLPKLATLGAKQTPAQAKTTATTTITSSSIHAVWCVQRFWSHVRTIEQQQQANGSVQFIYVIFN